LLKAAIDIGAWWLAAAMLVQAFLVTVALGRVFLLAYWRPAPDAATADSTHEEPAGLMSRPTVALPILGFTGLTLFFGIYPEPFLQLGQAAAISLADPTAYIASVFGKGGSP
jgi:multicomponent Na+:H+ antiporter subunit D